MQTKVNWKEVLIFYAVAVLVSAPFRLGYVQLDKLVPLPYNLTMFFSILRGIGPAVGAFVVYVVLKSKIRPNLTFWGPDKAVAILAVLIIPTGLAIIGVNDDTGINVHYKGLITGVVLILYALGEELGWRFYLQQALAPIAPFYRVVLIALLWYVWHLNFLRPGMSPATHGIHFLALLAGSWGLFKISESTHSLLFVVAVHLSFNILADVDSDFSNKMIMLGVVAAVWTVLIIYLQKSTHKEPRTQ